MHAMNWHMGMALGGIRLQVPDSQVVRALEVLDDFEPDDGPADEDDEEMEEVACCPECESLEIREVCKGRIPARSRCGRLRYRFPSLRPKPASLEMPGLRLSVAGTGESRTGIQKCS